MGANVSSSSQHMAFIDIFFTVDYYDDFIFKPDLLINKCCNKLKTKIDYEDRVNEFLMHNLSESHAAVM